MKTKLIFNTFLSKHLLKRGNPIIDLLKDHKRRDGVVCVFEETKKFENDFAELNKELYGRDVRNLKRMRKY
jgi:hypothetical protein